MVAPGEGTEGPFGALGGPTGAPRDREGYLVVAGFCLIDNGGPWGPRGMKGEDRYAFLFAFCLLFCVFVVLLVSSVKTLVCSLGCIVLFLGFRV